MIDLWQATKDFYSKNEYALESYPIKKKSKFALICPGGGYEMVCSFVEGKPYAKALNELGFSAFVLRYRVKGKARFPAPMDDLARAVRYILDHSEELNVEREGWSLWGSSAGGHLAASFGTDNMGYISRKLPAPAALVLSYPVITMESFTHKGSAARLLGKEWTPADIQSTSIEKNVSSNYPPTFVWCSRTDEIVDWHNSNMLAEALEKNNVPHQFLLYETGRHGCGIGKGTANESWFGEAVEFWSKYR